MRGFSANFILLDAEPLADIANTKEIQGVVVNGTWLDRSQLDEILREAKPPAAMEYLPAADDMKRELE